jgi:septal ring factor EnvC (AmiA/AmiB activator)
MVPFRGEGTVRLNAGVMAVFLIASLPPALRATLPPEPDRQERLEALQRDIVRLRRDLDSLQGRERTLLGEIARLDAGLRLHQARVDETSLRLEEITAALAERFHRLAVLERTQDERRAYLTFRLREMYKRGPGEGVRRMLGGAEGRSWLAGLGYAAWLSDRDARTLEQFRRDTTRLRDERDALTVESEILAQVRAEAEEARASLEVVRTQRASLLAGVARDRRKHQEAIEEMEAAARGLGRLVEGMPETPSPALEVRKFRGLLDWPAAGRVRTGFGRTVHPRFKTVVPHPGLDIEAPEGSDILAVFDGTVRFASWLHGYGLTLILDHGGGVLSVYAHASALLAEPGQQVLRGDRIGKVGDTGSLRGPFLYFEIREDGRPVDPARWLRRR